jgi:hypothetical protein
VGKFSPGTEQHTQGATIAGQEGTMHRFSILILLVIVLFAGSLHAESCCSSDVNQKIHRAIAYAVAHNLSSFEVDLGSVDRKMKPLTPKGDINPEIWAFANGVNSSKDKDIDEECWDYYFSYTVGTYIYLAVLAANYEMTDEPIQLVYSLDGPKIKTYKRSKTIPAQRLLAYFLRTRLGDSPGTYLFETAIKWRTATALILLDSIRTNFYVPNVE